MGSGYSTLCAVTTATKDSQMNTPAFETVGVIPHVLNDLFRKRDEAQQKEPNSTYFVKVSFVEVYNEEIKDLFCPSGFRKPLNIREENNSIRVVNLSETIVTDLLEKGSGMRMTGGTAMNEQSSRSHAIFTITLEQIKGENDLVKSKFHLVELAGSERQSKTKAEGIRLKEGILFLLNNYIRQVTFILDKFI